MATMRCCCSGGSGHSVGLKALLRVSHEAARRLAVVPGLAIKAGESWLEWTALEGPFFNATLLSGVTFLLAVETSLGG